MSVNHLFIRMAVSSNEFCLIGALVVFFFHFSFNFLISEGKTGIERVLEVFYDCRVFFFPNSVKNKHIGYGEKLSPNTNIFTHCKRGVILKVSRQFFIFSYYDKRVIYFLPAVCFKFILEKTR